MPKVISACELTLGERPPRHRLLPWLHGELRSAILDGRLRTGTRMPATRDLAGQVGISRGSVVAVYQQLEAAGLLVARRGSGTWVSKWAPKPLEKAGESVAKRPFPLTRLAGLTWTHPPRPFQYGQAVNEFPIELWSRIAGRRMRGASSGLLTGWSDGHGYPPLCAALAGTLGSVRGVHCTPDQVVIISGVQQGLDLLARFLLKPGDEVWMEDPGYFGAIDAFSGAGGRLVPVPVDDEGLDVAEGRRRAPRARLAYLTPTHQFPLGVVMSRRRRLAALEWARESGGYLLEDDYDSELRFSVPSISTLQSLDHHGRVILVGTFNKLLFPAVRLGYLVLPHALLDEFLAFRLRTDLHTVGIDQAVLCDFIMEGHLGRHMRRMRDLYASRLGALSDEAARHLRGLLDISPVRAGLCTTGLLRNGMSSREAEEAARREGVETQALSRHVLQRDDVRGLLLGFAAFPEKAIRPAVESLARALTSTGLRGLTGRARMGRCVERK
ncbi:HTH-type transcriptional regulatory protein GabR [mine drainage metagenome]|uniref:HTH-type transcriptional regulatory protein GabR n=1 Tax=mine drainage metagenome TaxID=410659 RepID=A0A1J5TRV0_9ZZZZ